jgi:hypothetical protein
MAVQSQYGEIGGLPHWKCTPLKIAIKSDNVSQSVKFIYFYDATYKNKAKISRKKWQAKNYAQILKIK